MLNQNWRFIAAALAASSVLLGCGGGGSSDAAQAAADPAVAAEEVDQGAAPTSEAERDAMAAADRAEGVPLEVGPDLPVDETAIAAAQAEEEAASREQAQTLTVDSSDSGYAKPRVVAVDWVTDNSSTKAALLAKFKFVILGARGGTGLKSFTEAIKSRNSNTKIAYYTMFNELPCSEGSSAYYAPAVRHANGANQWLRYASGSRAQWTDQYGHCDMNISRWGRLDSDDRKWTSYKAKFDYERIFGLAPKIEYVFSDNTMKAPRVDADWKRIGTNQSRTNTEIAAAQRMGQRAYWDSIKARKSSLKVMGNVDSDMSQYEYEDRLEGAYIEGAMGKSWSLEAWAGWGAMMDRYRDVLSNTKWPHDVVLQAYGDAGNYKRVRYGLASALLENGWFAYVPLGQGGFKAKWYDEYSAPIGKPIESPPNGPKSNGIWARKYENGIVLVNPKSYSATINVGTSYKRLKGTQDSYVNNGAYQSNVTLPAKSGLIMIKR
jgi:hypothetical protein